RALPYLRAGLPASYAGGAGEEAALGVSLLAPEGCAAEVRRTARLAGLSRGQAGELRRACEGHATAVRTALGSSAPALNAAAERAWIACLADRNRILRPDQLERMRRVMDASMEPGHTH
ncbi:MAG TPA: hypothetical protein VF142_23000, partial [Longimicrobium sp.]